VSKLRLGVFASGGGTNLQAIIGGCERGDIAADVAVAFSDKPEAGALDRARRHGIAAVHVPVPKTGTDGWLEADRQITAVLQEHEVGLVCLAGYMRKIGPALLEAFRGRIMNIHPALLPAFPGVHVQALQLEYGVKVAGCTVHFADEEFDRGPIIIQAAVPVREDDTAESLAARILEKEHIIYARAIQWFAQGRLRLEGRIVRIEGVTSAAIL